MHDQRIADIQTQQHGATWSSAGKGGGALCAGNAVALLVFGPVMP